MVRVTRRRRWWTVASAALVGVLGVVLAIVLLRPEPVLLDPDDFPGVARTHQNGHNAPPGWTYCDLSVGGWVREGSPDTALVFGPDQWAGAAIAVQPGGRSESAAELLDRLQERAASCATSELTQSGRFSIEPLSGLGPGEVGWRTRYEDPLQWGEYVVIPLDEGRLLAVGFQTTEETAPVDMDRLVELAKQGAEQFPATE